MSTYAIFHFHVNKIVIGGNILNFLYFMQPCDNYPDASTLKGKVKSQKSVTCHQECPLET